jgi:hypothetical protein
MAFQATHVEHPQLLAPRPSSTDSNIAVSSARESKFLSMAAMLESPSMGALRPLAWP